MLLSSSRPRPQVCEGILSSTNLFPRRKHLHGGLWQLHTTSPSIGAKFQKTTLESKPTICVVVGTWDWSQSDLNCCSGLDVPLRVRVLRSVSQTGATCPGCHAHLKADGTGKIWLLPSVASMLRQQPNKQSSASVLQHYNNSCGFKFMKKGNSHNWVLLVSESCGLNSIRISWLDPGLVFFLVHEEFFPPRIPKVQQLQ